MSSSSVKSSSGSTASKLKFKFKGDKHKKKKKMKSTESSRSSDMSGNSSGGSSSSSSGSNIETFHKVAAKTPTIEADAPTEDSEDEFLTPSQLAHKKKARAKEIDIAKDRAAISYRQRINEFNKKLASTTEHNDIPRVSAAGNG